MAGGCLWACGVLGACVGGVVPPGRCPREKKSGGAVGGGAPGRCPPGDKVGGEVGGGCPREVPPGEKVGGEVGGGAPRRWPREKKSGGAVGGGGRGGCPREDVVSQGPECARQSSLPADPTIPVKLLRQLAPDMGARHDRSVNMSALKSGNGVT